MDKEQVLNSASFHAARTLQAIEKVQRRIRTGSQDVAVNVASWRGTALELLVELRDILDGATDCAHATIKAIRLEEAEEERDTEPFADEQPFSGIPRND